MLIDELVLVRDSTRRPSWPHSGGCSDQAEGPGADDSAASRALLRGILEADSDVEVVGQATDGSEAVAMARRLGPDIAATLLTRAAFTGGTG
jgi:hypothetical protein